MIWILSFVALVLVLALGHLVWRHLLHRWSWMKGIEIVLMVIFLPIVFVCFALAIGLHFKQPFWDWALLMIIPITTSFITALGFGLSFLGKR